MQYTLIVSYTSKNTLTLYLDVEVLCFDYTRLKIFYDYL